MVQVVGSQARILYSDCRGRVELAVAFNDAVRRQTLAVCHLIDTNPLSTSSHIKWWHL